ncbi:MAG: phosphatidate cytidylyltransferase [Alphaproteobacteria bacterium]|nr:MAG: phosphatidate cytidylyltransferase [Alphaproteobacteria bacterium]
MGKLFDKNFFTRLLSAIILFPIVLYILYLGGLALYVLLAFAAFIMAYEWYSIISPRTAALGRLWWCALGIVWVIAPIVALYILREFGFDVILYPLLLVVVTDTMAYVGGRTIGGPKLAPSISPGKTWSGFVVGIISAAVFSIAMQHFGYLDFLPNELTALIGFFGGALALLSQVSDLLESKFKRIFGVKDSGKIIPGHGGLLDRTDSLVLTLPAYLGALVVSLHDIPILF